MKHLSTALLAAAVAQATAQEPVHHPLANPVPFVEIGDNGQGHQWYCEPSPTSVLGGSMVTNRSQLLQTGNPVALLRTATGVPRLMIAEERLPTNEFLYHGLTIRGEWVAAPFPVAQQATNFDFGEQLFLLDAGNGLAQFWNSWRGAWLTFPNGSTTTPVIITRQRSCIVVNDGSSLQGYSAFGFLPVTLPTPNAAAYVPGTGSTLHSQAAFLTGNDEYHVFSPHANRWTRVHVPQGIQAVGRVEYDESIVFFQVGNEAIFVSAYTGNITRHTFTDLDRILTGNTQPASPSYLIEDNVGIFQDLVTGEGVIYRPIDDTIFTFTGLAATDTRKTNNEFAGFFRGGRTYEFVSGAARGTPVATLSIPTGFNRVTDKLDDAVCVVVTDEPAAYGYSSLTNRWYRTPLLGQVRTNDVDGQDFIGLVPTSTHVYGFSPRRGDWAAIPVSSPTIPILKEDGVLAVVDGSSVHCFGTESSQWVVLPAAAIPVTRGVQDDYYYEVADDPAGPGSRIRFYSRITDQWSESTIAHRITTPASEIAHSDQCMLLRTPSAIVAFSAFGDLTSQYSWPMDNFPYHAVAGAPSARFVASGPANGLNYVAFGFGRGPGITVPPALGQLLLPLSPEPVPVAIGFFSANGTLQYDIALPPNLLPITFHMQNINLEPGSSPRIVFGRSLFPFQVH